MVSLMHTTTTRSLRILFVTRHIYRDGTTAHIQGLGKALIDRGHLVAVAGGNRLQRAPHELTSLGIAVHEIEFPNVVHPRSVIKAMKAAGAVRKLIGSFAPDIIHVHMRSTSIYALGARVLAGVPFVSTIHATGIPTDGPLGRLSFWGSRAIAISEETECDLRERFKVSENRIRRIVHGVDEGRFCRPTSDERLAARAQLGIDRNAFVVSMVSRLDRVKRHDLLLRATAQLIDRFPNVRVVIAGSGELAGELKVMTAHYRLEPHVQFVGHLDPVGVYWASDISVSASDSEGFPYNVIESMMCGVPVIRTPAGGHRDQIQDGVDGVIVPFDDHQALAAAIERLIGDRRRLDAIAEAALASARARFSLSVMATKTEAVYFEALSSLRKRDTR